MKATNFAKKSLRSAWDSFEELDGQLGRPILEEAASQLGSFFGTKKELSRVPKTIAHEELFRARQKKEAEEKSQEDNKNSQQASEQLIVTLREQYQSELQHSNQQQREIKEQVVELTEEVVKLSKEAGLDTKIHLETMPKKVGILDIKRLTFIIRYLKLKAKASKSGQELVNQRSNAKRTTGMLAWVSGKQMKVHEQGTLTLQG